MFARVARFEGVDVAAARSSMDEAEAVIRPLMEGLAGYAGHMDLMSEDGQVISITLFDSEENARAGEATFDEEMPRKLEGLFASWQGRRVAVDRFEVVTDVRR